MKKKKKTAKDLQDKNKSLTFAPQLKKQASLAQLVEQLTLNQWVQSSNL